MSDAPGLVGARILLVSHDLNLAGAPLLLIELAGLLRRGGAEPEIAMYLERGAVHADVADLCRAQGLPRVPLPSPDDRQALLDRYRLVIVNTVVPQPWVERLLGGDGSVPSELAARCAGRMVWWIHEIQSERMGAEMASTLARVHVVVFDSHSGRERWRGAAGIDLPAQALVIYPAVSEALMESAITAFEAERSREEVVRGQGARRRTRRALGLGRDDCVVLAVGWLIAEKGTAEVIDAFAMVQRREARAGVVARPLRLVIVGLNAGPESRRIIELVAGLPPAIAERIHLVPATGEVSPYFAAADVFVLNTLPPGEMFGRVLIEAMAHRLPALASDRGGPAEILIHNTTGWLHRAGETAVLADHIERLWHDPELARAMGAAGHRRVRDLFAQPEMWRRWRELLGDLLDAPVLALGPWCTGEEVGPPSPFPHMEAISCQLDDGVAGGRIFLFGGFSRTYWDLNQEIALYDPAARRWSPGPALPADELGELARTHAGVGTDGRFVYIVSGQPGPRYSPACRAAWALHLASGRWLRLPDLPVARYGPAARYWRGELHVLGGDREDRTTLSDEHWILTIRSPDAAVDEDEDLDRFARRLAGAAWRRGPDIPLPGDHCGHLWRERGDELELYLVGGEHGHAARDASPDARPGAYIAHPYLLRLGVAAQRWELLAELPLPVHHIEHQVLLLADRLLVVLGGATHGAAVSERIQVYDLATDRWTLHQAALPDGLIGAVAWSDADRIYVNGGQTWASADDRRPGGVTSRTIAARYRVLR